MTLKNFFSVVFYLIVIGLGLVVLNFLVEFTSLRVDKEPKWVLQWEDEFERAGKPDSSLWKYDIGDGCPRLCGWGNNELQYYTDSIKNVFIKDGRLHIKVLKDSIGNRAFSSTRIKSRKDMLYGKLEVKLKNPKEVGTWPAVWMLPTQNEYGFWPRSGEIDIMEHVGYNPDSIFGTVHTKAYNHLAKTEKGGSKVITDNESAFHLYGIIWDEEKIDFLIDDEIYYTFENENKGSEEWPFDQSFHLIMNVAVGGNWGGREGVSENISGQEMVVEYVRFYEDSNLEKKE